MFADHFNPKAALTAAHCPRCKALGLTEIDPATYEATPRANRYQAQCLIDPSVYARCAACGCVMEWPGCCE
jgi:phage FluMu protein Com